MKIKIDVVSPRTRKHSTREVDCLFYRHLYPKAMPDLTDIVVYEISMKMTPKAKKTLCVFASPDRSECEDWFEHMNMPMIPIENVVHGGER